MFHTFTVAACAQQLTHMHTSQKVRAAIFEIRIIHLSYDLCFGYKKKEKKRNKGHKTGQMKKEGGEVAADSDKVYQFSQSGPFKSAKSSQL